MNTSGQVFTQISQPMHFSFWITIRMGTDVAAFR